MADKKTKRGSASNSASKINRRTELRAQDSEPGNISNTDTEVYVLDDIYPASQNSNEDMANDASSNTRRERCLTNSSSEVYQYNTENHTHNAWTPYVYPISNAFTSYR